MTSGAQYNSDVRTCTVARIYILRKGNNILPGGTVKIAPKTPDDQVALWFRNCTSDDVNVNTYFL